jgi:uncharacterized damage-inducible protein DinB
MPLPFPHISAPDTAGPVARSMMLLLHTFHWRLWNEVKDMTPEQLDWRPSAEGDSIAMILDHLIAAEAGLIEIVFHGKAVADVVPSDNGKLGTHLHRWGRESCLRAGCEADIYLSDLLALYERSMALVAFLSDEQLLQTRRHLWPGERIPMTEGIMHLAEHLSHHKGQIVYIAEMNGFPQAQQQ